MNILTLISEFNFYSVLVRLLLAVVLGGIIGVERGRHGRAAGLRTHILVCLGAALTSLIGLYASNVLGITFKLSIVSYTSLALGNVIPSSILPSAQTILLVARVKVVKATNSNKIKSFLINFIYFLHSLF
jgi:hypothetical protein